MLRKIHKQIIDYVISYIGDSNDDWFKIKMQIINVMPPKERSNFSRRHEVTKKHTLNSFDYEVIKYWKLKTGIDLKIDPNKLQSNDWIEDRGSGYGLRVWWDEKRKRENVTGDD